MKLCHSDSLFIIVLLLNLSLSPSSPKRAIQDRLEYRERDPPGVGPPHYAHPLNARHAEIVSTFSKFAVEFIKRERPVKLDRPELVRRFCFGRKGSCSLFEVTLLHHTLSEAGFPGVIENDSFNERWGKPTARIAKGRRKQLESTCKRLKTPTVQSFFAYVYGSEPVIIEGELQNWSALQKWDLAYLMDKVGESKVRFYVSDDELFEKVTSVANLASSLGYAEGIGNTEKPYKKGNLENVVVRPAENEATFAEFVNLVRALQDKEASKVPIPYLQKHPMQKWFEISNLMDDVSPRLGKGWADVLQLDYHLLWLSTNLSKQIEAPIHFDQHENLHAVIKGEKTFELFHPFESSHLYFNGTTEFRTVYLFFDWKFSGKEGEISWRFFKTPYEASERLVQPFSPVNISHPDYSKHPLYANARKVTCEVKPGDAIFIPSNWWHRVISKPEKTDGICLGINYFFKPFYIPATNIVYFGENGEYDYVIKRTGSINEAFDREGL